MTSVAEFESIESEAFAASVNIASDLSMAIRICRTHSSVEALTARVGRTAGDATAVLSELACLAEAEINRAYASPWDAALLALLVATLDGAQMLSHRAAELAQRAPNCWWSRRLAADIMSGRRSPAPQHAPLPPARDDARLAAFVIPSLGSLHHLPWSDTSDVLQGLRRLSGMQPIAATTSPALEMSFRVHAP